MNTPPPANGHTIYRITISGTLDANWSKWFSGLTVQCDTAADGTPLTVLTGEVRDQAALRGILNKVWDLNLTLVAVTQIER